MEGPSILLESTTAITSLPNNKENELIYYVSTIQNISYNNLIAFQRCQFHFKQTNAHMTNCPIHIQLRCMHPFHT